MPGWCTPRSTACTSNISKATGRCAWGGSGINWGISTVWNPNDIFNAFSLPISITKKPRQRCLAGEVLPALTSSVELKAVRMFDNFDEATIAGMWKFNKGSYDIQILGGYDRNYLVYGRRLGRQPGRCWYPMKGEFTYFLPWTKNRMTLLRQRWG